MIIPILGSIACYYSIGLLWFSYHMGVYDYSKDRFTWWSPRRFTYQLMRPRRRPIAMGTRTSIPYLLEISWFWFPILLIMTMLWFKGCSGKVLRSGLSRHD